MIRYGKCEGYSKKPCPNCGRHRLENYSKGYSICEKCGWCVQLGRYVLADEFDYKCDECAKFQTCVYRSPGYSACEEFEEKKTELHPYFDEHNRKSTHE